jgi:long-chain acyl-CoA synthetase
VTSSLTRIASTVNHVVSNPPPEGHTIRSVGLHGTREMSLTELYRASGRLARHLYDQGLRPGDRVGVLAANSLEWVLLDLAALRLKLVTAGFEPGKFTPDAALRKRYGLAALYTDRDATGPGIGSLGQIWEAVGPGPATPPVRAAYAPTDATTIKFTSGSTGEPKGLAASVGSIDSSLRGVQRMFAHGPGDDLFVFLPLSLLQQRYWIYSALAYGHDVTISTYEAAFLALRRVHPTVVMGVPGFFESARGHIERQARAAGAGDDQAALRAAARSMFGERVRYLWTGSAPARLATLRFFHGTDLPIFEGYGLNETCIVSKNHPAAHREGSVGAVLPGKQVLLDEDGVVSVRSDHPVNVRYEFAAPGESERVFGSDGVVRTGDLGYLDEDGFLYIRGRADDTIVLDNGRKVVVRPIEEQLKASPAIDECVVFCPSQTQLVAVVSPARLPADAAAIRDHLAVSNAALSPDERVSRVVIAHERFSIANGLLTSQYKPRRQHILRRYQSAIKSEEGINA